MLLESPNPKDPQDAEVAKMLMETPKQFAQKAHDWAVKYAGAPRQEMVKHNYSEEKQTMAPKDDATRSGIPSFPSSGPSASFPPSTTSAPAGASGEQSQAGDDQHQLVVFFVAVCVAILTKLRDDRYQGYNKDLIDRFVNMGFDVDKVVEAFNFVGIDRNGGEDYELEEAYMGDITARLLGEQ